MMFELPVFSGFLNIVPSCSSARPLVCKMHSLDKVNSGPHKTLGSSFFMKLNKVIAAMKHNNIPLVLGGILKANLTSSLHNDGKCMLITDAHVATMATSKGKELAVKCEKFLTDVRLMLGQVNLQDCELCQKLAMHRASCSCAPTCLDECYSTRPVWWGWMVMDTLGIDELAAAAATLCAYAQPNRSTPTTASSEWLMCWWPSCCATAWASRLAITRSSLSATSLRYKLTSFCNRHRCDPHDPAPTPKTAVSHRQASAACTCTRLHAPGDPQRNQKHKCRKRLHISLEVS